MNSAPTNTLPAPATNIGTPAGLVVCAFTIAPPSSEFIYPAHNRIALGLTEVLLGRAAVADGHSAIGGVTRMGDLNEGVLLADYEMAEQAAQSWLGALRHTELLPDAHLAWRDAEGVWHPVHPRKLDFNFEAVTGVEFIEREKAILQLMIRLSELTVRQLRLELVLSIVKGQS